MQRDVRRSLAVTALKSALAILLLLATLRLLDAKLPFELLGQIDLRFILVGLVAGTLAQFASALRWHFTARRMNAPISLRFAIAECYFSTFLNQTLPFGIGGDAVRIARHGASLRQGSVGYGLALRTHVVERIAGQIVLAPFAGLAALAWAPSLTRTHVGLVVALVVVLGAAAWWRHRTSTTRTRWLAWLDEAHDALLARKAWLTQLSLSSSIVLGCLAMYFCCALALGIELSLGDVVRIGPLVLLAMALPISAGGFGPREAASTALFSASALDPGRGTLVALVYGVLSLLASLPAIPLWLLRNGETRAAP